MGKIRRSFKPHTDGSTRYTVHDLYRENNLDEIVDSTKFRIVGWNPMRYNRFDIMPVDILDDEFFRLSEDIFEHVMDPGNLLVKETSISLLDEMISMLFRITLILMFVVFFILCQRRSSSSHQKNWT